MPPQPELPLPPPELRFMDASAEAMLRTADSLAQSLVEWGVMVPGATVLDIGCGYGRLAYGLLRQGGLGRYVGLDILPRHIGWLQQNLLPVLPAGSEFRLTDVANGRYNPAGSVATDAVAFPAIAAPGAVVLFSVFTHMVADDITNYLRAIAAILAPGITGCATFFLMNDDMRALQAAGKSRYRLAHPVSPICAIMDPAQPLHAIGFEESWVRGQFAAQGLAIRAVHFGTWCGRSGGPFQDAVVFERA